MSDLKVSNIKSNGTGFNDVVSFQNASGTENGTLCRAWVNFDGTGTVAIRADLNVDSITDEGTGDYRILLTNNLVDNDYAVVISATVRNNASEVLQNGIRSSAGDWVSGENAMSNSSVRILNRASSGAGDVDIDVVCVAFFR